MQQLEAGWLGALADAGYTPSDARLYLLAGARPSSGRSAMWFEPGSIVYRTLETPFSPAQLRDVNDPVIRQQHRVCAFFAERPAVVIAKMRHELEHARQWDVAGKEVFDIYKHVYDMGSILFGGLPQSGRFYSLVPAEQDANAAAARFAQAHLSPEAITAEIAGDQSVLFRSPAVTDPLTLLNRMVGFAAIWRTTFEQVLSDAGESLATVLDSAALTLWRELEADQVFQSLCEPSASQQRAQAHPTSPAGPRQPSGMNGYDSPTQSTPQQPEPPHGPGPSRNAAPPHGGAGSIAARLELQGVAVPPDYRFPCIWALRSRSGASTSALLLFVDAVVSGDAYETLAADEHQACRTGLL
jgi:hypothetical protein